MVRPMRLSDLFRRTRLRRAARKHVRTLEDAQFPATPGAAAFDQVWDMIGHASIELDDPVSRPRRPAIPFAAAFVSAASVAAAVAIWFALPGGDPGMIRYETAPGEQRMIRLDDGSMVTLNTASIIRTRVTPSAREVHVERGEAYFDVVSDADAPFSVSWADAEARVLGTRFNVLIRHDGMEVDVIEGRVAVGRVRGDAEALAAGQAAALGADGLVRARRPSQADRIAAWREGRVVFDAAPLHAAVEEMNRYSALQIVIDSQALTELPVSGRFRAGSSEDFARALEISHGVATRRDGAFIRLAEPVERAIP
ncbi:DUF4974 domain-containing protein [Glycocaulis profundi]|nr:DUF4974 domain-containing protein [Glycocaulis profundi]